jgi:hypothetical protein
VLSASRQTHTPLGFGSSQARSGASRLRNAAFNSRRDELMYRRHTAQANSGHISVVASAATAAAAAMGAASTTAGEASAAARV